jgi:cytochrome c oxidase cbb3-type subunit III
MNAPGLWLLAYLAVVLSGCGHRTENYTVPDEVTDFSALYSGNCAGCHGRDGRFGAARPLNDPLYLNLIGKDRLRDVIAKGVPRTAMSAFAQRAGGELTDQQITILADQIVARWSRPLEASNATLPPYSADLGDTVRGEAVFKAYCKRCHGEGGSIVNRAFLALVSDQSLRTTVIAGRADEGIPNCRTYSADHPMTAQEVSDVVAWLSAHRGDRAEGEKSPL